MQTLKIMYEKVKSILGPDWVTPLFLVIFMFTWTLNAFKHSSFDLNQLQEMYIKVRGAYLLQHGIDSGLNSRMGEMPASAPKRGEV